MLLTTHLLLVPRSWKSRAISTHPLDHTGPVTGKIYELVYRKSLNTSEGTTSWMHVDFFEIWSILLFESSYVLKTYSNLCTKSEERSCNINRFYLEWIFWRERKKPTRCNNQMFIINFCLNIFRASLCPKNVETEVDNEHLIVASCWLFLSLHTLLTMHGHRNLKNILTSCQLACKCNIWTRNAKKITRIYQWRAWDNVLVFIQWHQPLSFVWLHTSEKIIAEWPWVESMHAFPRFL